MIVPVFILFGILSFLFLNEKSYSRPNVLVAILIFVAMLIIITFRDINMPDAANYIADFESASLEGRFEIGYQKLKQFVQLLSGEYLLLFFVVGVISLLIKFKAIISLSPYFYGCLLVYLSNYFILHDMIQMRAGIVSGLLLFSISYTTERNFKYFLMILAIAFCFHSSASILLVLWFIPLIRLNKKLWILIVPFCYLLAIKGLTIAKFIKILPFTFIQSAWHRYELSMQSYQSTGINIFNVEVISKLVLLTLLIWFYPLIEKKFVTIRIWLMIYTLAFIVFVLMSDVPLMAYRLSQILMIVEIIIIPMLVFIFENRFVGKIAVVLIALCFLLMITFYNSYLI